MFTRGIEGELVLDGLSKIDWRSVRHAYGPAAEIPHLLRWYALDVIDPLSRSLDEEDALGPDDLPEIRLFELLTAGNVSPAVPLVLPFLVELCAHDLVRDRVSVLSVLNELLDIAAGRLRHIAYGGFDQREEYEIARATWAAAQRGLPVLYQLTQSTDDTVRELAYSLFTRLTQTAV